jgi:hypothetical protein
MSKARSTLLKMVEVVKNNDTQKIGLLQKHIMDMEDVPGLSDKMTTTLEFLTVIRWVQTGMQRVTLTHKLAAAFMATDVPSGYLHLPWPAFEISVPNNLLVSGSDQIESIFVLQKDDFIALTFVWEQYETLLYLDANINAELPRLPSFEEEQGLDTAELVPHRIITLAQKLVINTVLAISTYNAAPTSSDFRVKSRVSKEGANVHEYTTGQPLRLDCVQDIRDYVAGRVGTAPKVTTLVRGHWKNQAHGAARAQRKLLWIQPYPRGEGPVLVRPTQMTERHIDGGAHE